MKLIPQIAADLDDYPELRTLADVALRRVAELMSIHAIVELRRIYKKGVFDHPYSKDVVTPINLREVPHTVRAGQHAVGKALLDYLETIGINGLQLEVTQEDAQSIASLWMPPASPEPEKGENLDPKPAVAPNEVNEQAADGNANAETKSEAVNEKQETKEDDKNGKA